MRIDFKVPVKWDELTPWQRDRVGKIFFNPEAVEKDLFQKLMGIILFLPSPSFKNICKLFILLYRVPLSYLVDYTDFLFDPADVYIVAVLITNTYFSSYFPSSSFRRSEIYRFFKNILFAHGFVCYWTSHKFPI